MTLYTALFVALSLVASKVAAAGQEDVFEWQPEIHHQFRPAEDMPSAWFSQLFTLIVLSPWLLLALGVSIFFLFSHSSQCTHSTLSSSGL